MCDFSANAACDEVLLPPRCSAGSTGFFPGTRCFEFIYCQNGSILLNLTCQDGMYFNAEATSCLFDTGNTCPRTRGIVESSEKNPEQIWEQN